MPPALRSRLLFAALYFSEGAPIGFIWWFLPTYFRSSGVPVEQIAGLSGVLVLPWAFKFLWAPLVDRLRGNHWGFRHWALTAQAAMALTLVPLWWFEPAANITWIFWLLLAHAVAAATQDVAIDGLAIATIPPAERGRVNGWMQSGMLLGRSLLGGGALLLAGSFEFSAVLGLLLGCLALPALLLVFHRETPAEEEAETQTVHGPLLLKVLRQRRTWVALAFALTGGAAFEALGALAGPWLYDRGFTAGDVGYFFALPVVAATIAGSLAGGRLADRRGHLRAALLGTCGMVLGVLAVSLVDRPGWYTAAGGFGGSLHLALLLLSIQTAYLMLGLFTAASYAWLMDQTEPGLAATQFSAYMGATNGCEAWAAMAAGVGAKGGSYAAALLVPLAVSTGAAALLRFFGGQRDSAD